MSTTANTPLKEIHKTLDLCNFFTRLIGLSFIDVSSATLYGGQFVLSIFSMVSLVVGEFFYVGGLLAKTTSVAEFVATLHIVGYGILSAIKLLTMWFKRYQFRKLLEEMADIWPVAPIDQEEENIKHDSLRALRLGQLGYTFLNVLGVFVFNLTPIGIHIYRLCRGVPSDLGYVWHATYPFDKTKNIYHELVYGFEMFAGFACVSSMLSSDLLFMTMASHIGMLLRVLQVKIRRLPYAAPGAAAAADDDCYSEIAKVTKLHQRLISYSNDLEDAFSFGNLINVLLSSVNICCVVFVIVLLEPLMNMGNKFFLAAAMSQVGFLCWYADDIFQAQSVGVADAAYESGWHGGGTRARRALVILIQRSQKPLYFTALKFRPITMITYTSILTNSYSYFALLYTVYRNG